MFFMLVDSNIDTTTKADTATDTNTMTDTNKKISQLCQFSSQKKVRV